MTVTEPFDVAGGIAAVERHPVTRWWATIIRASVFVGQDYGGTAVEIGRRMGHKNIRTDDPVERNDTKILEVVVALDSIPPPVIGQRVTGYVLASK